MTIRSIQACGASTGEFVTRTLRRGELIHATFATSETPRVQRQTLCGKQADDILRGVRFSLSYVWSCKSCIKAVERFQREEAE